MAKNTSTKPAKYFPKIKLKVVFKLQKAKHVMIDQDNNYKKNNVRIIYPKLKTSSNKYNYYRIDWQSVISGCHASFNFEKRFIIPPPVEKNPLAMSSALCA